MENNLIPQIMLITLIGWTRVAKKSTHLQIKTLRYLVEVIQVVGLMLLFALMALCGQQVLTKEFGTIKMDGNRSMEEQLKSVVTQMVMYGLHNKALQFSKDKVFTVDGMQRSVELLK